MGERGGAVKRGDEPYLNYPKTSHNFPLNYNLIPAHCSGQFALSTNIQSRQDEQNIVLQQEKGS